MTAFAGFGPEVHAFFTGLEADNRRAYFSVHRDVFEASVRGQLQAMLSELAGALGGDTKLFRPNRDVRFSRDKSPYKTNTYGLVLGAPLGPHGLYVSISADGLVAGSGYHVMARDQLERYRAGVDDEGRGSELARRADGAQRAGLELWGESLATAPRGYPRDHARIELLRRRSLAVGARHPCPDGIGRDAALRFVTDTWRAAAPVTGWLDAHVGPSTLPDGGRERGRRGR